MKKIISIILLFTSGNMAFAQKQPAIPLYPNGIPNSKPTPATYKETTNPWGGVNKVSVPMLTPFLPAAGTANGAAILIMPGGGYSGLALDHEGDNIAKAFTNIGVTAFILKYRMPSDSVMIDKTIGPLQDAQRAMQIIRQQASAWNIDPNRVGVIGFSAGGHLASTLATHYDKAVIANKNNVNLRPDFAALIYPVITFGPDAHVGSRENLIGKNPPQELIDLYSNEKQVTANTPPTFLVHAEDDNVVPVQNSILFYEALLKNHVKAEMHLYQAGGHGFGLNNKTTKDQWFERLKNWMDENGWLTKK